MLLKLRAFMLFLSKFWTYEYEFMNVNHIVYIQFHMECSFIKHKRNTIINKSIIAGLHWIKQFK